MNYDDYYDGYSEIDQLITDLKSGALKGLKQDIKDKLDRLEKENKELQEVKTNWRKLENEYKDKVRKVEYEKEEILRNAKQEIYNSTLKDLFDNCSLFENVYKLKYEYIDKPKCDLCDDNREFTIITPDGEKHKHKCLCSGRKNKYYVEKDKEISIYIQKGARENNFRFEVKSEGSYTYANKIASEDVICSINLKDKEFTKKLKERHYYIYFKNDNMAQKCCDYLNKGIEEK